MVRINAVIIAALVILNVLIVFPANAAIQATKVEIRGAIASTIEKPIPSGGFNLSNIVNAPVNWTPQSFAGFYYDLKDELGREELEIAQTDLSKSQRAIGEDNLAYRTTAQKKKLKVVKDGFSDSANAAAEAGLEGVGSAFTSSGEYLIMGWQGEKYIAVNNKIDKFKVADKSDVLRLYPKVDYELVSPNAELTIAPATTPITTPIATPTATEAATRVSHITPTAASTTSINTPPEPRATSTPEVPGFEAVFAIAGLLAIAYLVMRK